MRTKRRSLLAIAAAAAVAVSAIVTAPVATATPRQHEAPAAPVSVDSAASAGAASALSGSQFDPGFIISDEQFFNRSALTEAQIQTFLVNMVGACSNSNCLAVHRASSTSKAADAWCNAYAGSANESAAAIIYKVQRACGVSAKAILVTLQKEQGLITKSAPSAGAVRIAMGYGCPDTAPCESLYYGFFNQVYLAARQFQRYGGPGLNWYPVGQVSAVRYHPNAACGALPVLIKNRATAALYYYTPYTPNAAALANLGGTGDGCSSYGNRNFWKFYNSWFGITVAEAGSYINNAYTAAGGAGGALGAAAGAVSCDSAIFSCSRTYAHGLIYWTYSGGTLVVSGRIGDLYLKMGGTASSIGIPAKAAQTVTDPNGNGFAQAFANGWIHDGPPGVFASTKRIMTGYSAAGWLRGPLGWPTGTEKCGPSGTACLQTFAGGRVVGSSATDSAVIPAAVATMFDSTGGINGSLGWPIKATQTVTDPKGNGFAQKFQKGWIHSSSAGTFVTSNNLMNAYSASGWLRGELGWPVKAESCGPAGTGCIQEYAGGYVFGLQSGGSARIAAKVAAVYKSSGGPTGSLGYPQALTQTVTDKNGNGFAQKFQKGWIHSSNSGDFISPTSVMTAYSAAGWVRGWLGWPETAAACDGSGCSQSFDGGRLTVPAAGFAIGVPDVSNPQIAELYASLGGESSWLGRPITATSTVTDKNGNGFTQRFVGGWIHSSAKGTFATSSTLMSAYSAAGWIRGPLGWPTAAQTCDPSECTQTFSGGTLRKAVAGTPPVGGGAISTLYQSLGGTQSLLGLPLKAATAVTDSNGNGTVQQFEGGWVHSSAKGTFVTGSSLMTAYSAAKWVRGSLGWPTANQVCSALGCSQTFVGGALTVK